MDDTQIKYFVEAALLAAGRPLSVDQLQRLFDEDSMPDKSQIRQALTALAEDYEDRGLTLTEVASGFRIQIELGMAERLQRLWEERPPRYSRAMFETLALIAYRQPMTRGEIEEIRGVSVSSNIVRSLLEREWVRVVGHRDVPGRPEMFGTTKQFLDYFGLKKLDDLPPLADLSDWESLRVQLNLPAVDENEAGEVTEGEASADPDQGPEATDIPSLEPESFDDTVVFEDAGPVESTPPTDDAVAADDLPVNDDIEPIAATEWPGPEVSDTVVKVLDPDEAIDDEDREDASVTGA